MTICRTIKDIQTVIESYFCKREIVFADLITRIFIKGLTLDNLTFNYWNCQCSRNCANLSFVSRKYREAFKILLQKL